MDGDMDRIRVPFFKIVPRTVVLVGRTGNGKSSTGNSIIGKSVFTSEVSFSGVTRTLDCQTAFFPDGRILNVIDTPGLVNFHVGSEFIKNEIMQSFELAKHGTQAVILVLSLRSRFTEEEADAIQCLSTFFGPSIFNYMIVLFTGEDCLKKDTSREDYLRNKTPLQLQEVLRICKNRTVLFDNETDNEEKKKLQLGNLLSLVEKVVRDNGGHPYTGSLLTEFKVESKLRERIKRLEDQLAHVKEACSYFAMIAEEMKGEAEEIDELRCKIKRISCDAQFTFACMNSAVAEESAEESKRLWEDKMKKMREEMEHAKWMAVDCQKKMEKMNMDLAEAEKSAEESKKLWEDKMKRTIEEVKNELDIQGICTIS